MSQVNLDALIQREDLFKVSDDESETTQDKPDYDVLRIDSDLHPSKAWFFKTLRKADFQRETSEWKPERIAGLIRSFINGDIIPSIILWNWKGTNFIIDGGHRLSALIAWILNDYGDGAISKNYFGEENITSDQKKNADKTRKLIDNDKEIGAFSTYDFALNNPEKVSPEQSLKARILVNRTIQVQWIRAKTSRDAEKSFFRINGEATPIDETEAVILKSREKPNAIAARAIIHSGSAHKYWKNFDNPKQREVEAIATKINKLLFEPELDPKIIHFPIAGKEYSTHSLELVFSIVNMINDLDEINHNQKNLLKKDAEVIKPPKDETGEETIKYLSRVERIVSIISGQEGYSLGLSPLVYFYNLRGRFQITSFLAIVHLIMQWEKERKSNSNRMTFQRFSAIRDKFEAFLLENKRFTTQATLNIGSGIKSYKRLADLYSFIIEKFLGKETPENILELIKNDPQFGFIKVNEAENKYEETRNQPGKKPPKETVNAVVIRTFLNAKIVCPICGGHATFYSYNIDHIEAIRNGGRSDLANLQMGHFYCNEEKETIQRIKEEVKASSSPELST